MKTKKILFILIFIITFQFILIIYLSKNQIKKKSLHLKKGDRINFLKLVTNNNKKTKFDLKSNRLVLVFLFSKPCTPCNKNIEIWNRIAYSSGNKDNIFGIIFGDQNEKEYLKQTRKINFPLVFPQNNNYFFKNIRLNSAISHTILFNYGRIEYLKNGQLNENDFFIIKNYLKEG